MLSLQVEAHRDLEESHLWMGEFTKAHEHLDQAFRLEEFQVSLPPFLHGHSPSVRPRRVSRTQDDG
jgi:hypothetical protein